MELRSRLGGIAFCSKQGGQYERRVVEAILGGGDKLFVYRLWRQVSICADGTEVGKDAEDALGLQVDRRGRCSHPCNDVAGLLRHGRIRQRDRDRLLSMHGIANRIEDRRELRNSGDYGKIFS